MAIASGFQTELGELQAVFQAASTKARQTGSPCLASYSRAIPALDALEFFARARISSREAFFWERAEDKFRIATAGAVITLEGKGSQRFAQTEQQWQDLLQNAYIVRDEIQDLWGIGPALVGGFSFEADYPTSQRWADFGEGQLTLPQVQLISRAEGCYITVNALLNSETNPAEEAERAYRLLQQLFVPAYRPDNTLPTNNSTEDIKPAQDWKDLVSRAVGTIKTGAFEKVVLAREVRLQADRILDIAGALQKLRQNYPSATLFAVCRAGRCFIGATPERLVRLAEGEVRTIGLAGSAPRGKTSEEDIALGQELLNSGKNQEEHAIVVRMLREALEKVCSYVWAEQQPCLLKLSNVQHLYTPVLGRLSSGSDASILKLLEQLHPTPALGGYPRQSALTWLRQNEDLERGWYAAPVGWLDSRGEGEFVVAIRSALVEGNSATLYAGCGIVAESDPEAEYNETILKLRPMLNALGS